MSARDWLYARLVGACIDPERVSVELDAYRTEILREAAEKIRTHIDDVWPREFVSGATAADLIDTDKESQS